MGLSSAVSFHSDVQPPVPIAPSPCHGLPATPFLQWYGPNDLQPWLQWPTSSGCLPILHLSGSEYIPLSMVLWIVHLKLESSPCTPQWMVFELGPTRPLTTSRRPSNCTAVALPHRAGITLLLAIIPENGHGYALGHHNDISLSPHCSTWHFKSMGVSWAHKASGPMMNSSVISVTSIQIHWSCHPRVSSTSASFKTGRVSLYAICRTYSWLGSLSWAVLWWYQAWQ
jgi:hypothetical protein